MWGRVHQVIPPTGPDVVYEYDELGNLLTAERGNATTALRYDNAGRKTGMDDPDMGFEGTTSDNLWGWTYAYDALGNLTQQTDARNCTLTMQYDDLNRLIDKNSNSDAQCLTQVHTTYTISHKLSNLGDCQDRL